MKQWVIAVVVVDIHAIAVLAVTVRTSVLVDDVSSLQEGDWRTLGTNFVMVLLR